jgi:hypothetical protein
MSLRSWADERLGVGGTLNEGLVRGIKSIVESYYAICEMFVPALGATGILYLFDIQTNVTIPFSGVSVSGPPWSMYLIIFVIWGRAIYKRIHCSWP